MLKFSQYYNLYTENIDKIVAIYPGRFHPFHRGHYGAYRDLVTEFGDCYVATSGKQSPTSPFSFDEKREIISTMYGIPSDKIIETKIPYVADEVISKFNLDTTAVVYGVSEKDRDERFPFVSQDGPNLKKNGDMAHLQKFTQIQAMESVSKFSYIKVVPTNPIEPPPTGSPLVEVFEKFFPTGPDGNVVSGTNVRKAFKGISEELLPDLFTYLFGGYNDKIFNIVKRRLR